MSISVRPMVGRMRASAPVTVWDLLSFVEIWTDSSVFCMADSAACVSEMAPTKFPPSATKTLMPPSRIRLMVSTASTPCSRGGSKPNSLPRASMNDCGICSQMPMVRSPWTLLCPRMGEAPAPGLPMLPRSRSRLMISLMVATAFFCWVMPMAQVMMTFSAFR